MNTDFILNNFEINVRMNCMSYTGQLNLGLRIESIDRILLEITLYNNINKQKTKSCRESFRTNYENCLCARIPFFIKVCFGKDL